MDFTRIITWLLWRFAPVQWLERAIGGLIAWALALLEDEDHRAWLDEHPHNAHWFGGWLSVIEARLDELIDLRAHQLLALDWLPRDVPGHYPMRGVRSASEGLARFLRLIERFADAERLARRRADKLVRLFEADTLITLSDYHPADHRPAEPALIAPHAPHASPHMPGAPSAVTAAVTFFSQRIRAPPWLVPIQKTSTNPTC